jgi:hypothetical protein
MLTPLGRLMRSPITGEGGTGMVKIKVKVRKLDKLETTHTSPPYQ